MEQLFWTMMWKLHAENGRATEQEELGFPGTVEPPSPVLLHPHSFYTRQTKFYLVYAIFILGFQSFTAEP